MATTKQKFQNIVFKLANQKLVDFLNEFQKLAIGAFGIETHAIIEQFINGKMPKHLEKPKRQVHLENGTNEQIVTRLEKQVKLIGLEAPDQLKWSTVSNGDTNANASRPKSTCHYCKKPGQNRTQYRPLNRQNEQADDTQFIPGIEHVAPPTVSQTTTPTIKITTTSTKTVTELKETQKLFIHPMRHVGRQTTPQGNVTLEPMQPMDRFPEIEDRKKRIRSHKETIKTFQTKLLKLKPEIQTEIATSSLWSCN